MATRAEYFARWSALHGGYDPASSPYVSGWLTVVHSLARPFVALRVPPWAVSLLGLLLSGAAVPAAVAGGGWLWLAALLLLLSGLADGVDGAVAVQTGRASAGGYVLDSVVDRGSDLLALVVLWQVGAPAGVCVAAGAATFLLEYMRARATAAGMSDVGVVTVAERPARVVLTVAVLVGAAVTDGHLLRSTPGGQWWATLGAWVWLGLGTVALVQLSVVVRARLAGRTPPGTG
jgi:CDP-diacylglycerol--glycerol-3-phosphate 3-phosphatidyltransferase